MSQPSSHRKGYEVIPLALVVASGALVLVTTIIGVFLLGWLIGLD